MGNEELISRLRDYHDQVLKGFRHISRLDEANLIQAAITALAPLSGPVDASGEPNVRELLIAPCRWCRYNGPNYWSEGTHATTCPWREIGGEVERLAIVLANPIEALSTMLPTATVPSSPAQQHKITCPQNELAQRGSRDVETNLWGDMRCNCSSPALPPSSPADSPIEKVLKIPRRMEYLGGQKVSYVQLDNVLAVLEASAPSPSGPQKEKNNG